MLSPRHLLSPLFSLLAEMPRATQWLGPSSLGLLPTAYRSRLGAFVSKVLMTIGRPRPYVSQVLPSTVIDVIRGGLGSPMAPCRL